MTVDATVVTSAAVAAVAPSRRAFLVPAVIVWPTLGTHWPCAREPFAVRFVPICLPSAGVHVVLGWAHYVFSLAFRCPPPPPPPHATRRLKRLWRYRHCRRHNHRRHRCRRRPGGDARNHVPPLLRPSGTSARWCRRRVPIVVVALIVVVVVVVVPVIVSRIRHDRSS